MQEKLVITAELSDERSHKAVRHLDLYCEFMRRVQEISANPKYAEIEIKIRVGREESSEPQLPPI